MTVPRSAQSPEGQRTLTPALLGVMWIALFGFGTFFLNYATLVTAGQRMGLTTVTAGAVLTVMMIAVVVVQPLAPLLNSRLGPRLVFCTALGLQAIGNLLNVMTDYPLAALLFGSIVGGLGFGILVVIGTAVVPSTVEPRRLGRALGFFGATTATATAIGAPVGLWLLNTLPTTGFRLLSFGLVLLALPAILTLPRRQRASTRSSTQGNGSPQHSTRTRVVGLGTVLLPVAIALTVFGVVLAFGPGIPEVSAVPYIVSMQVLSIVGRFLASASLDRYSTSTVMIIGIITVLTGLILTALLSAGWGLTLTMMVLGFGIGTVQASSLLLCFEQAGSANRGSVAWNMTFDIGLGFAGVVGGLGFSHWGPTTTFMVCAALLTLTGVLFALYFRTRKT